MYLSIYCFYVYFIFRDRPVTAFFETKNEAIDKILPIMTQPFDFKQKK